MLAVGVIMVGLLLPSAQRVAVQVEARWWDVGGPALLVQLTPQEGWHLYWQNPGDAGGLPPRVTLSLPLGWSQGATTFSTPTVLGEASATVIGYEGPCNLLVAIEPDIQALPGDARAHPTLPATVGVSISWLVCKEQCERGQWQSSCLVPDSTLLPLPPDVSARFPHPAPDGTSLRLLQGEPRGTDESPKHVIELTLPETVGSLSGARVVLDPDPAFTAAVGGVAVEGANGTFRVPGDLQVADCAAEGLAVRGLVLRKGAPALSFTFLVPPSAIAANEAVARRVDHTIQPRQGDTP